MYIYVYIYLFFYLSIYLSTYLYIIYIYYKLDLYIIYIIIVYNHEITHTTYAICRDKFLAFLQEQKFTKPY